MRKTWFIDLDGTLQKHNSDGELDNLIKKYSRNSHKHEKTVEGIEEFLELIKNDCVVITTARDERHAPHTISVLHYFNIKYDKIIFGIGSAESIVVNDIKPVGVVENDIELNTAFAYNLKRDAGFKQLNIDLQENNVFKQSTSA